MLAFRLSKIRMKIHAGFALVLFALTASVTIGNAGVTVLQNLAPGATSWPGSPIISTVSNPSSQANVPESFNGVGGNTNLSQTFTITTTNYTLQAIDIYAGTGSGTGSGTNIVLKLYDLGIQSAPNPSAYNSSIIGGDLFGSGTGLPVSYVQSGSLRCAREFDFTNADQVTLANGHMYAFELTGVGGTVPVFWQRTASDTYSGGAAYRNQGWINSGNARDFAMAVYAVGVSNSPPPPPLTGQCAVNWNDVRQRMDGFGGGVVFLDAGLDPMTAANMDTLFNTNNSSQLGLSLLRVRIDPTTNWVTALADAQKAVARGGRVMATPWTPPAIMKTNNNTIGGGAGSKPVYQLCDLLEQFCRLHEIKTACNSRRFQSKTNRMRMSLYESCFWSGTQFQAFCRSNALLPSPMRR